MWERREQKESWKGRKGKRLRGREREEGGKAKEEEMRENGRRERVGKEKGKRLGKKRGWGGFLHVMITDLLVGHVGYDPSQPSKTSASSSKHAVEVVWQCLRELIFFIEEKREQTERN